MEVQLAPQQTRPVPSAKKGTLGAAAVTEFQSLATGLRDSRLKDAVARLVQRHKGAGGRGRP